MEAILTVGYYALITFLGIASLALIDLILVGLYRLLRINILVNAMASISVNLFRRFSSTTPKFQQYNLRLAKAFITIGNLIVIVKKLIQ